MPSRTSLVTGAAMIAALAAIAVLAGCGDDDGPIVTVTADLTITPASGTVLTDFQCDASVSTSSGPALQFRWDWEGDGTWDTGWSSTGVVTRRFAEAAGGQLDSIEVQVQVRADSRTDSAAAEIEVDARHGTVLKTFEIPVSIEYASALGADDAGLWLADWGAPGTHRLYAFDPTTGDTLRSIPSPDLWPCGVAWDGTYLCVTGYLWLRRLNVSTGEVVSTFPVVYSAHSGGLAWDGEVFYHGSDQNYAGDEGDGLIHKYSADGTEVGSFASPRGSLHPNALAYDGLNLWVTTASSDSVYVVDAQDGAVLRPLDLGGQARLITVFDDHLWIGGGNTIQQLVP